MYDLLELTNPDTERLIFYSYCDPSDFMAGQVIAQAPGIGFYILLGRVKNREYLVVEEHNFRFEESPNMMNPMHACDSKVRTG